MLSQAFFMILKNNKLLVIQGPTATGKSALAIFLAKQFDGELISADSRQVYTQMDIGTGKLFDSEIKTWGYDLVSPTDEFSVSHFEQFALKKIDEIHKRGKLPILVGGTGLYIKAVLEHLPEISIPVNFPLRKALSALSVSQLFAELEMIDPARSLRMNESDSNNPRRLVRAIEIASHKPDKTLKKLRHFDTLLIGLTGSLEYIESRIKKSIDDRLAAGFSDEVMKLTKVVPHDSKALSATGYKEVQRLSEGSLSEIEAKKLWLTREMQYVKRQMKWFKKIADIVWFDIAEPGHTRAVEKLVKKWHNTTV